MVPYQEKEQRNLLLKIQNGKFKKKSKRKLLLKIQNGKLKNEEKKKRGKVEWL